MAVHCHQPVGNFDGVLEQAYREAYEPFLGVLERHPGVRLSLHYSGSLLDWLIAERPEFISRLAKLAKQGRIEMLASGYYEPILPIIPEADRQGQIALMRRTLQKLFGGDRAGTVIAGERSESRYWGEGVSATAGLPTGLWLTERVWEPELPRTLADAGIRYTILDANQFRVAKSVLPRHLQVEDGDEWDVFGSYSTEYTGSPVTLFPASRRLRYWIPFQDVGRTVEFLRRLQSHGPVAITYADDGEKFGLWPKTHDWVYGQGWLEQFFSALERESSWLATSTFHDYAAGTEPDGRVYLPCGSYDEMLEWSGGYFRNFFVKYPESNALLQKMTSVSRRLQAAGGKVKAGSRSAKLISQARHELYQGQCNDAYWHGVFGGLYLSHLRRALYQHVITAERLLDQASGRLTEISEEDVDGDQQAEVIVRTPAVSLVVDPQENGAVVELDHRGRAVNLLDTLARRYEPYHDKLRTPHAAAGAAHQGPASIHDMLEVKEQGLGALLRYDDHRRVWFIDYALSKMLSLEALIGSAWVEHRLWPGGPWTVDRAEAGRKSKEQAIQLSRKVQGGTLRKQISVSTDKPRAAFRYDIDQLDIPVVGLEWNVCLDDEQWRKPSWQEGARELRLADRHLGLEATMTLEPAGSLALFPVETVSGSEGGLERTYQGLAVVALWPTGGSRRWGCSVTWSLQTL